MYLNAKNLLHRLRQFFYEKQLIKTLKLQKIPVKNSTMIPTEYASKNPRNY